MTLGYKPYTKYFANSKTLVLELEFLLKRDLSISTDKWEQFVNTGVTTITVKLVWHSSTVAWRWGEVLRARQSKNRFMEEWGDRELEIG